MLNLNTIAQGAFYFSLIFSIVITVIGLAFLSAGIEVPPQITSLMLPTSYFVNATRNIVANYPSEPTSSSVAWVKAFVAALTAILQFLYTLLTGFLTMVVTLAQLIPPQLSFFVPPLFFIGAFLQLAEWYYVTQKVLNLLGVSVSFAAT